MSEIFPSRHDRNRNEITESSNQSAYAELQFPLLKRTPEGNETLSFIKSKVEGKTLLDVGGGNSQFMEDFAKENGASKYINVDIREHTNTPKYPNSEYIHKDVMEYLRSGVKFPGGLNIALNGIDTTIINNLEDLPDYLAQIAQKGNIVFGVKGSVDADISTFFSDEFWNKKVDNWHHFVFEKK